MVGNRKFLLYAVRELHRKSEYSILGFLNIFKRLTWKEPTNIKELKKLRNVELLEPE